MAYAFRAATSQGNASGGALTVTKPTGTVDDDLIVVVAYLESDTNTWASVGAGFTEDTGANIDNTGAFDMRVWWKKASGEPASWTWTPTTNNWRTVVCCSFSGTLGTAGGRVDVRATGQADGATTFSCPTVTTTVDNDLLCAYVGNFGGGAYGYTSGPANTERIDFGGLTLYSLDDAGAAGVEAATVLNAGTQDYAGGQIAFKLDTGGGGGAATQVGWVGAGWW